MYVVNKVMVAGIRAVLIVLLVLVASCSKTKDQYVEKSVGELYNDGLDLLLKKDYAAAAKQFIELERQHPYSKWAARGQVLLAYAYYENQNYVSAIDAIQNFVQLHPSHDLVPYMYYLQGMSYYEQVPIIQRDQEFTHKCLEAFQNLCERFPESRYARDAKVKMEFVHDHLAGKELDIGRFYLRKKSYIASINRLTRVLESYEKTRHAEEALHRMVEAYVALGMKDDAIRTAAILGHNFPHSPWYADAYYLLKGEDLRLDKYKKDLRPWTKRIFDAHN